MYEATRIFSSNLTAKKVQRFYNLVLLPRVRDDITEYKRLNYHLYMVSMTINKFWHARTGNYQSIVTFTNQVHYYFQALKKSLFKPSAFFKGILLPLCEVRKL